jgi:hypothetical protein
MNETRLFRLFRADGAECEYAGYRAVEAQVTVIDGVFVNAEAIKFPECEKGEEVIVAVRGGGVPAPLLTPLRVSAHVAPTFEVECLRMEEHKPWRR